MASLWRLQNRVPIKIIVSQWSAPLRPFLAELGTLNEATISQVEAACAAAPLKIRTRRGLQAVEEGDLCSGLSAANVPQIVQRALTNGIKAEPDRCQTQWVVDWNSPGEQGGVCIYSHRVWEEERKRMEEEERKR